MKLIIIAAGQGSRIRSMTDGIPKTLLKLKGKSLLDRVIENAVSVGIKDAVIVTGYRSPDLVSYVDSQNYDINVETIYNANWDKANGLSVLAAKPLIPQGEPFLISMSDHVYDAQLLEKIILSSLKKYDALVGLDFRINEIYDIDDGMKVSVDNNTISKIIGMSKTLPEFDAIDCGVFKCKFDFFNALEAANESGNCSLADACNMLIAKSRMGGVDIGNSFWMDVDTPEAFEELVK
ncbi:MAG: NTP transferase domain-containing protein [Candidatus Marinimicrobia bacterium]|jgi:choline kinase|nr:NTP transferase domain-containing protein [Candidatus Neomarinimicrobiota bacterium]MBT4068500.1 NTP transferase domain-containing protein [Candidatus Neomarinimicrobiota bacterium]MBT4809223.1 NTP transferase domain-containing protein [Candidatus Neomarinimicrobiota bacterium]MBT6130056.1 NTP transferase domain-containing protein [Candidatus Neomarinimicrobiota bacterium]MBT6637440.1 NTP transferase domain-containing protein [Candidatus Neomarinimicrobiota bacterium]